MKKKLLTLLLTACLLLTCLAGLGADASALDCGMDAFAPIRVYDGHFADVRASDWYYGSVVSLYELGLAEGQSPTAFGSRSSVSLAEVATFAARIHSIYYFGSPSAGPAVFADAGGSWYEQYVAYLKNFGITDGGFDGAWGRAATRAEAAHILARTLPGNELGGINRDTVAAGYSSARYIIDVRSDTPYADEILTLYAAGVVTGSDSSGSFLPYTEITRAELAAILTRIVCPEKRVLLDWVVPAKPEPEPEPEPVNPDPEPFNPDPVDPDPDPDPEPEPEPEPEPFVPAVGTYPALVFEQGRYIPSHSVDDEQSILSNIRWIFRNGETELKLKLEPSAMRPEPLNRLLENYLAASQLYLEQGYTSVGCRYDSQGNVTLSFSNPNGGDRDAALTRALVLYDRFHADGTITRDMNQVQIARVYAQYLCDTCQYDYSSARLSHTAYGALINGNAVCEGYTAAYNILLKLEGINASTAQSPDHIWTTATLDGILYHIDVTWCDQAYGFEPMYFCMTPEFSLSRPL